MRILSSPSAALTPSPAFSLVVGIVASSHTLTDIISGSGNVVLCTWSLSWRHRTHRVHRPGSWRGWRGPGTVWFDIFRAKEGIHKENTTETLRKKAETKMEGTHRGNCVRRVFCHATLLKGERRSRGNVLQSLIKELRR